MRPTQPRDTATRSRTGPLEALNGTLLFGLTTAFLFAMIREVREIEKNQRQRMQGQGSHQGT
jgi:hypothetical protein